MREAAIRLETRAIPLAGPRRGRFAIEPSLDEAREAFQARRAAETGILSTATAAKPAAIEKSRDHIRRDRDAIRPGDAGDRLHPPGEFHACTADAFGHRIRSHVLRDPTARAVPIPARCQSTHDAEESRDEHETSAVALAAGDLARAAEPIPARTGTVVGGLARCVGHDPRQASRLETRSKRGRENPGRRPGHENPAGLKNTPAAKKGPSLNAPTLKTPSLKNAQP
jgi:DNA-binding GntR family transcriptional regulator